MSSARQNVLARRRLRGVGVATFLALLWIAPPAWSTQVTEVRVGRHPEFTRVVFELDRPAGYRVERKTGASGPELTVTLDAAARSQSIPFRTKGISKVVVEPGGSSSVAHITLREEGIRVREMILANPPRIVLDVMRANTVMVAKKPAPQPVAETVVAERAAAQKAAAERAAAEKAAAEQAAKERAAAEKAAAERAAAEKAAAERAAAEKAAAEQAAKERAAAEKAAAEQAAKERAAAEKAAAELAAAEKAAAQRAAAEQAAAEKAGAQVLAAAEQAEAGADATAAPEPAAKTPPVRPAPVAKADKRESAAPKAAKTPPAPEPSGSSGITAWLTDPTLLAAVAGGVLLLVGVTLVMRRKRPLPNDLDVMAIAAGSEGEDGQSLTQSLKQVDSDVLEPSTGGSALDGLFDDEPDSDLPAAQAGSSRRSAPPAAPPSADDSLFDEPDADPRAATMMGDQSMNQGTSDLPADPDRMGAAPSPARSTAAPDSDVLRVVHELERRMGQLETKLQEANEARERLERQVAAQSEELRVQRAAIARTQRALRTMSRGDEDKATEPALRDGDTQTKTRVSVE